MGYVTIPHGVCNESWSIKDEERNLNAREGTSGAHTRLLPINREKEGIMNSTRAASVAKRDACKPFSRSKPIHQRTLCALTCAHRVEAADQNIARF